MAIKHVVSEGLGFATTVQFSITTGLSMGAAAVFDETVSDAATFVFPERPTRFVFPARPRAFVFPPRPTEFEES